MAVTICRWVITVGLIVMVYRETGFIWLTVAISFLYLALESATFLIRDIRKGLK